MAGEALFVFGDADTEMSVLVRDCDVSRALNMIHKTLVSDMCAPIDSFDALEFATTFVAANKKEPFDMVFVGEFELEEIVDIPLIFDVRQSKRNGLAIMPVDNTGDNPQIGSQMWELRPVTRH